MTDRSDDVTIYMAESPRVLILNKTGVGDMTEIIQQDLAESIRYLEKERAQMDDMPLLSTAGKQDLGGGVTVGITNTLENTQWGFEARTVSVSGGTVTTGDTNGVLLIDTNADFITEGVTKGAMVFNLTDSGAVGTVLRVVDLNTLLLTVQMDDGVLNTFVIGDVYKIWNVVQCKVSGGNMVSRDAAKATIDQLFPTAFTQVILATSSSATLQEQEDIQHSSFGGGITIDTVGGVSGTTFPTGTSRQPSDNLADAKTIAATRGFNKLFLESDYTFQASDNIDGFIIIGDGQEYTTVTLTTGVSTFSTTFKLMSVTGTQDGETHYCDCEILTLNNVHCEFTRCRFVGPITMHPTAQDTTNVFDCYSGVAGLGTPIIDMNDSPMNIGMRSYSGGIEIQNCTDSLADLSFDFVAGHLIIDSTVTAGNFVVRGGCRVTDNSTSVTSITRTTLDDVIEMLQNKLTIDETNSKLQLWNKAGDAVIYEWPITDKDAGSVVLQGTGPANRGVRT